MMASDVWLHYCVEEPLWCCSKNNDFSLSQPQFLILKRYLTFYHDKVGQKTCPVSEPQQEASLMKVQIAVGIARSQTRQKRQIIRVQCKSQDTDERCNNCNQFQVGLTRTRTARGVSGERERRDIGGGSLRACVDLGGSAEGLKDAAHSRLQGRGYGLMLVQVLQEIKV